MNSGSGRYGRVFVAVSLRDLSLSFSLLLLLLPRRDERNGLFVAGIVGINFLCLNGVVVAGGFGRCSRVSCLCCP